MPNPPKEWTIMVYMAGDNNLSEEMITGLKGMLANAGRSNINLLAVYDSCRPTIPIKIYDFSTKRNGSQDLKAYSLDSKLVAKIPYTTTEFLGIKHFTKWVLTNKDFHAERYGLIIAGHSDGILGRSLVRDDEPRGSLDLRKLRGILDKSRSYIEYPPKKDKFDLIGFDSCLMSMLEVSYEFRDIANVMVGSEGNIPSAGWNYREIVDSIPVDGKIEPADLGRAIVRIYGGFNQDYEIGGRALDISACDLTKIQPVVDCVNAVARIILEVLNLDTGKPDAEKTQTQTANFVVKQLYIDAVQLAHLQSQLYLHNQAVDVLDFIQNFLVQAARRYYESIVIHNSENAGAATLPNVIATTFKDYFDLLFTERDALKAAAEPDPQGNPSFILDSQDVGPEYQYSKGVALFFPWTELALDLAYKRYKGLAFNAEPREWMKFIEKLTNVTLREGESLPFLSAVKPVKGAALGFDLNLITFKHYVDIGHRQHAGRQHAGRQHAGRGEFETFTKYFSEFRNYSTEEN